MSAPKFSKAKIARLKLWRDGWNEGWTDGKKRGAQNERKRILALLRRNGYSNTGAFYFLRRNEQ